MKNGEKIYGSSMKVKVIRIGSLGVASHRYIDTFEEEIIDKVVILYNEFQDNEIKNFKEGALQLKREQVLNKINFVRYSISFFDKYLLIINQIFGFVPPRFIAERFFFKNLHKYLKSYIGFNILWVGENDFDGSNMLHYSVSKLARSIGLKQLKSYKETRYKTKADERFSLSQSDSLIFPNKKYINFFKRLYRDDMFKNKHIAFSDQDQRSIYQYEALKNRIKKEKYSNNDGLPHLAIIAGIAACEACPRSGDRYVIYNQIERLVKSGIHVHLFVKKIVISRSRPSEAKDNIYIKLQKKYQNFKIDQREISLNSEVYDDILRCDFGWMHDNLDQSNISLYEFQKINIPNRFYEYILCELCPVMPETNFKEETVQLEVVKCNDGIIFSDMYDLRSKMISKLKELSNRTYLNNFPNTFSRLIMNTMKKKLPYGEA